LVEEIVYSLNKYQETEGIEDINDPSAFVGAVVDEQNKKLYIFDEFYKKGMLNDAIAKLIKDKGYSKEIITADSAEQKSIEEIKREGIPRIKAARKGKDSILNGIQFIQQYEIIVHPLCVNIILELKNYTWKKDKSTGEYINEAVDKFNHLLDALRYAMENIMRTHFKPMAEVSTVTYDDIFSASYEEYF
jgi:phage terminase large subunit